nr:hypothetical protein GCM10025699_54980 [Microbacterium flavescens]
MLYWFLKTLIATPLVLSIFRPWVRGAEHVPRSGAVIFASNHLSFVDSIFLPLALDRRISFLAKSDYFTGKGVKGWAMRLFFTATGQLSIDRSGARRRRPRSRRGSRSSDGASSSASTPRGPAAPTAGSTGGGPEWRA